MTQGPSRSLMTKAGAFLMVPDEDTARDSATEMVYVSPGIRFRAPINTVTTLMVVNIDAENHLIKDACSLLIAACISARR